MVEEIYDIGAEGVGVENPSAIGDGHAELMFLVALAVEGNEPEVVRVGELQQRPGRG